MTAVVQGTSILLIYPPLVKAGEPPAGLGALAGCLRGHGVRCDLIDANLETQLWLMERVCTPVDTWSTRALKNRGRNLNALRQPATYTSIDRYQRAVRDTSRVLALAAADHPTLSLSLANYEDQALDPLASTDLHRAAAEYAANLYYPWFDEQLRPRIELAAPRCIGISLSFLSQALCSFSLIGFLRAVFPGIPLVLGGGLITSWMSAPGWNNPFADLVDLCVKGPGEGPLLDLLHIPRTQPHIPPDYTGLPLADYLAPGLILPYAASRGCYWNKCSFCPEPAEQSCYEPVPPQTAAAQLQELTSRMRPALIHLLDNAVSPALLHTLAETPPGAPWYGFVRMHEELADPAFCRRLHNSGCVLLKLGLESGSQKVLDAMHKGIDLDLAVRVLQTLAQAGIATYVYLLFGTPTESLAEARETLKLTKKLHASISFLNLAIFNMPREGADAGHMEGTAFSNGDLSLYLDFVHPLGWDRRAIRTFLDREFRRTPEIAVILRRDPHLFTSNHAPLFSPQFPWPQKKDAKNAL